MNRSYALLFLILAAGCAMAGLVWPLLIVQLIWWNTAFSFLLLSAAYAGAGPRLLLKTPAGKHHLLAWPLYWPYFLLNAFSFFVYRIRSKKPPFVKITDNLYFGRRLTRREAETHGELWHGVLDLACEFSESPIFRRKKNYCSLPVLDATAPTLDELQQALAWLSSATTQGPVYVHCALGHSRSATIVAAYLLQTSKFKSVRDAIAEVRRQRPGVQLHRSQRQVLEAFGRSLVEPESNENVLMR